MHRLIGLFFILVALVLASTLATAATYVVNLNQSLDIDGDLTNDVQYFACGPTCPAIRPLNGAGWVQGDTSQGDIWLAQSYSYASSPARTWQTGSGGFGFFWNDGNPVYSATGEVFLIRTTSMLFYKVRLNAIDSSDLQPATLEFLEVIGIGIVDFSGDKKSDLFWRNYGTGGNALWFMNGASFLNAASVPAVTDLNWRAEGNGDFNGDGKPDIVWRNYATGQNAFWAMDTNGVFITAYNFPSAPATGWQIAGTADFSRDSKMDIVWRNYSTGQNACWAMDLNGAFITAFNFPSQADANWRIVATADFSGDDRPDLVWRHYGTGQNAVWVIGNNGAFLTAFNLPPVTDTNWQIVGAADFNGDEKYDLLWRNYSTGANAYWALDYNGVFITAASLPGVVDINWQVAGPR